MYGSKDTWNFLFVLAIVGFAVFVAAGGWLLFHLGKAILTYIGVL